MGRPTTLAVHLPPAIVTSSSTVTKSPATNTTNLTKMTKSMKAKQKLQAGAEVKMIEGAKIDVTVMKTMTAKRNVNVTKVRIMIAVETVNVAIVTKTMTVRKVNIVAEKAKSAIIVMRTETKSTMEKIVRSTARGAKAVIKTIEA